jgi:FlaA1/EpsC-like NDP-sugar epimerase
LGTEFAKYLSPHHLVVGIDHSEENVARFKREFPDIKVYLKDFNYWDFSLYPMDLVIHCAAHKHVNLGEEYPHDFVKNNVIKTAELFENAYDNGVDILFISTDKAVEPTSVYGYTKALGEALCHQYDGSFARLGNILNSNGSVLPIWEKAIKEGSPVKITDPDMIRYYIDASEAVEQIWEGFLFGNEVIIPICDKLSLIQLFGQLVNKMGVDTEDVEVEIIGRRPGEKFEEKLTWDGEVY